MICYRCRQPYMDGACGCDDGITLIHGDCREVLGQLAAGSIDLVLTDPPYSVACHQGARSLRLGDKPLVTFDAIEITDLAAIMAMCGRVTRRWIVATMDWRHVAALEADPPDGLRFVRFGIWVKPNGAPQFTGDRPGPGWEAVGFLHRADERLRWNGGGRSSVFTCPKVETAHPTGKPERLIREWVALFSDPGDIILDPFMGSGTSLVAAKHLGRKGIGIELEERYCDVAARRLEQQVLPLEQPA